MPERPVTLDLFRVALPTRGFRHAAAERTVAERVVVRLITSQGRQGWGETLPREYVTGETLESVADDIERIYWPRLRDLRADTAAEALASLPSVEGERLMLAARCAVELAATMALGVEGPGGPGAAGVRVSGVLGADAPARTLRKLGWMRRYGLRHFKLKLGTDEDNDRAVLAGVRKALGGALSAGRCSLRVDANMAWAYKDVPAKAAWLAEQGVLALEQPCRATLGRLVDLAEQCPLPLIADESIRTEAELEVLLGAEGRIWPNIRISKCGGLAPARRLARLAHRENLPWVLGCMVGESGILSIAQRTLLATAPAPTMLEGNFGPFLLKDDLVQPSPRFGYGGRLRPGQRRFHVVVSPNKLRAHGQWLKRLE